VILRFLCLIGNLFLFAVFGRIILSWFPMSPDGVGATISSFLYGITEPVLGPIRRALPPVGMGGMALDLSPIVVIIGLTILFNIVGC
jgi:YggT family protein